MGQRRLAHTGNVLKEQVASGEECHDSQFYDLGLAFNDPGDILLYGLYRLYGVHNGLRSELCVGLVVRHGDSLTKGPKVVNF